MQTIETSIIHFLSENSRLILPVYQRPYSWNEDNCRKMMAELETYVGGNYFLGFFYTYVEKKNRMNKQLVDGQQRVTTIQLLLLAIRDTMKEFDATRYSNSFRSIFYLNDDFIYEDSSLEDLIKLELLDEDRINFNSLLAGGTISNSKSPLVKNYKFFRSYLCRVKNTLPEEGFKKYIRDIQKVLFNSSCTEVQTEEDVDTPQQIFESLNSTGKKLTASDLIKNFLYSKLSVEKQAFVQAKYWYHFEKKLGIRLSEIFRIFLSLKQKSVIPVGSVFVLFGHYFDNQNEYETTEDFFEDFSRFVDHYHAIIFRSHSNLVVNKKIANLHTLGEKLTYNFLVFLLDQLDKENLTKEDLVSVLELTETYILRRRLTGRSNIGVEDVFNDFIFENNGYLFSSYVEFISSLEDAFAFPNDEEFKEGIRTYFVFNTKMEKYMLLALENHGRNEKVIGSNTRTERIIPTELNNSWKNMLGENHKVIQETYSGTLANLTLVYYPAQDSNQTFSSKKAKMNTAPLLRLNQFIIEKENWTEEEIVERTGILVQNSMQIWPSIETYLETVFSLREEVHIN